MNAYELGVLQGEQQRHDEVAHRDILLLSKERRVTHMALHFAKYAGRLIEMEPLDLRELEKIVVDSTIICLTTANALGLSLEQQIGCGDDDTFTLHYADRPQVSLAALPMWMGTKLAVLNGRIAKACEAYDHHEDFPYDEVLSANVMEILDVCLASAGAVALDLGDAIRTRWAGIEKKALLRAA